ncbi:hypothetical protein [Arthrobacter bambusae]|uniref:hypothetical protein n=1 Tax=Arthrobacter bambusae TaxID=1338426 RepID=UPI00277ED91D|nr:hypothetical protein [Arthrobacter bambusae]MDQ0241164.1 hypothetical protein [Arthrobacter bambusae]
MATVRSRMARRGRTGRKATGIKIARRRVQVHHHHPRRYAGTHPTRNTAPKRRKAGVSRINKTGRHHRFLGRKKHVGPRAKRGTAIHRALKGRHGHRKFLGRKKSAHKRHMKPGLHRKFKGRKYHGRHVKPGQHRHFKGRKPSAHKRRISKPKPKAAPISSASYLSMF